MKNSFKELEKIQSKEFESKAGSVKKKIDSETSTFRFFGDVVELYFSKMTDVFVTMAGGGSSLKEEEEAEE